MTTTGETVRRLRESQGMSQDKLCERMRESGLSWYQGILSRVELGQRPLRLLEAYPLAQILRTTVDHLAGIDKQAGADRESMLRSVVEELKIHLEGIS